MRFAKFDFSRRHEQAPQRVAAAVLSQPVGHNPANPDYMYDASKTIWAKELRERQPDVSMETRYQTA